MYLHIYTHLLLPPPQQRYFVYNGKEKDNNVSSYSLLYIQHSSDNYDCSSKNRADDSNKSFSDLMVKIIDSFRE